MHGRGRRIPAAIAASCSPLFPSRTHTHTSSPAHTLAHTSSYPVDSRGMRSWSNAVPVCACLCVCVLRSVVCVRSCSHSRGCVCVGMSVFLRDDSSQRQQNPRWNPIFIYESRARMCVRLMLEFVVGSRTVLRGRVDSRIKSVNVYEMVAWWLP